MLQTAAAKALAALLAALALFVTGYTLGHRNGANAVQAKYLKVENKAQDAVLKHDAKVATAAAAQASDAQAVGAQVQTATENIHEVTKRIIVKVPVYVPAAANADCHINAGFVRLWNDANSGAAGDLPASASGGLKPPRPGAGFGELSTAKPFSFTPDGGADPSPAQ